MTLSPSGLRDLRYEVTVSGTGRRRFVPRKEVEFELRRWLAGQDIELSADAFSGLSDGTVYFVWLHCLRGNGLSTARFGQLPIELVSILEREGYDPENKTGLPTRLFKSWEPIR